MDLDQFKRTIGPVLASCDDLGVPPVIGRLAFSSEVARGGYSP